MSLLSLLLLGHSLLTPTGVQLVDAVEAEAVLARVASRPPPEPVEETGQRRASRVRFEVGEPATKRAEKLLALVEKIDQTRVDTEYTHVTKVHRSEGLYHFDCSGMMNWMLKRVSKKALEALERDRPVAATYVKVIERAPTKRARDGWRRVADIEEVEPGDIFAWRRPTDWPKQGASGHVGIVVAPPEPLPHIENGYAVRVLDSTRWKHEDDTRAEDETGWGRGNLLIVTDDDRHPIGYGWHGSSSTGFYRTSVVFGRLQ
jgi:cell wall-associated NlpC family hydrolase